MQRRLPIPTRMVLWAANALVYLRHPGWIMKFRRRLGFWPHASLPRTVNEKILWRKIFDRNPLYRMFADKLAVRTYVRARCPDLAMPEIVWIGNSGADIPDRFLTHEFIVKTNNGSSRNIFLDQGPPDRTKIAARLDNWLAHPYGVGGGQWAYRHVPPLVMVERMVCDQNEPDFLEFNYFVARGHVRLGFIQKNAKRGDWHRAVVLRDGQRLDARVDSFKGGEASVFPKDLVVPDNFHKAALLAEEIGADCDFVRVDFMNVGPRLYFGECTIFPNAGFSIYHGDAGARLSHSWDLRDSWFLRTPQRGPRRIYAAALGQASVWKP